jgi:hypothetical protein
MPRFVILRHEGRDPEQPSVHWDLMLESGAILRTWALAAFPTAGESTAAEQLPDHRLHYLDYEGPISGNRGTVTRWDRGTFEPVSESPTEFAIAIAGQTLHGRVALLRSATALSRWQFLYLPSGG